MTTLEKLAKECTLYGLVPEDVGPPSAFTDEEFMRGYIGHIQGFEAPAYYGCTKRHRDRAQKAWSKMIAGVTK